jgi:cell division protein FtsB
MVKKIKSVHIIIAFIIVFLSIGWVKSCSVEKTLKKANKELSELKAKNNTLVIENKKKQAQYETAKFVMDSIFSKSNITHEKEIHNYWNTVYNNLVVSDTSYEFISDYLYKLGQQ